MDSIRLYELQLEQKEVEIKKLQKEIESLELMILESRDDTYDWKLKYKELRKTITK